jgi:hypothetical protein
LDALRGRVGPGRACSSCHADSNAATGENNAPIFACAGSVYPSAHEPLDCICSGSEGAQLEITDANGVVYTQLPETSSTNRRALPFRIREAQVTEPRAKLGRRARPNPAALSGSKLLVTHPHKRERPSGWELLGRSTMSSLDYALAVVTDIPKTLITLEWARVGVVCAKTPRTVLSEGRENRCPFMFAGASCA